MAVTFGKKVEIAYGYGLFGFKNLSDFASTSEPPSMRKSEVERWLIPIPPLPLQNTYAEQVLRLDTSAQGLDSLVAKAKAMAASLSAEMFGA
jgi:type I restriction enzyme S subunit